MGLAAQDAQIACLFATDLFVRIVNNLPITLFQFNLVTNQLVALGIPYDVSFVPGTRKEAAALQLTIHINPTRTEVLVVALQPGATTFTPSP